MLLGAISFADPLMLAGLVAALVPVVLHLLNRVKAPVVPFPTLRFLRITAQKTARRRQIQQYFLLLVRVVVFALMAMAVAAPLIRGGSAGLAYTFVGMMLGALALLVLGGVWGAAAIDRAKASAPMPAQEGAAPAPRPRAGPYRVLSTVTFLLALLLAAAAAYGLISDHFFTGDRGTFTGRSTALAIILDNSHSMLAKEESATRLQRAKQLARQLLAETLRPAEAALLPTNPGDNPSTTPLTADTTRLLGNLDTLVAGAGTATRGRALPMQERIRTAVQLLEASRQPSKMLVVLSDYARPAFADAAVFAGIKESPLAADLQLVIVPLGTGGTAAGAAPADVGITSLALAAGSERPVVGAQMNFEASLLNNGDAADVRDFTFTVDGKPVAGTTQRVQLGAAGTASARTTLRIPYRLTEPGLHRFGLQLENAPDALAWDDRREIVLVVAPGVKVLILGAEEATQGSRPRARSAALYFEAALAPFAGRSGAAPWSIQPTYRAATGGGGVEPGSLTPGNYAVVFVCDLPTVPGPLADALLRYTRAGGTLVWVLGPAVNPASYNDVLITSHRDLLPAPLGEPLATPAATPVEWVDLRSGLFMNLFDSQEPFRSLLVNGRWGLQGGDPRGRVLLKLADNAPLLLEHVPAPSTPEGATASPVLGKVYTLLTTPGAAGSNLGGTVLLVPIATRRALGEASEAQGAASYEPGDTVQIRLPAYEGATDLAGLAAPSGATVSVDVTAPDGGVINARPLLIGDSGQTPRWSFDRTSADGVYRWRSTDARFNGLFVVNPPGEEADLLPADLAALAREAGPPPLTPGKTPIVAGTAGELLAQLEQRGEGTSLFPGFIAMVLMLAVVESLLSNRYKGAAQVRRPAVESMAPAAPQGAVAPVAATPVAAASRNTEKSAALRALEQAGRTPGE
jgi:hypothetical protein